MKRILASVLVVTFLALGPIPVGSVAYAEHVTEQVLMDQLTKIKAMVAEMEMKMMSKKMMMDPKGMDKTMDMLMEVTRMLRDIK